MTEKEAKMLIISENEKIFELLLNNLKSVAEKWKSDSVPVELVEISMKVIIDSFKKGLEE